MHRTLFLLFFSVMLLLLAACNNENEANQETVEKTITTVETATVKKGDLQVESSIYGNVMPSKQVPVIGQQPGEVTEVKVENGEAVKKDERIATIRTAMGRSGIFAPTDGKVGQLQLKEDDYYTAEEPFAMIYDDEKLLIQFQVTAEMRKNFKKEKKIDVIIEGEKYKAEIISVASLPNEVGQFDIQAEMENDAEILPGAIAEIIVKETRVKDTLLIATDAIVTESDETFVYIVENDTAKKVPVEIKAMQTDETAVEADLSEDDVVITSGQFLVGDGSKVEIIKDGNDS